MSRKTLIIIASLLTVLLVAIGIFISIYPKSAYKGYIEAYKVYLSNNNIDLLNLYLEREYPLEGMFKKTNLSRRKEIYQRIIDETEKKIADEEYSRKVASNMIKDGLVITDKKVLRES